MYKCINVNHVCVSVCTYICMSLCMYVCMYVWVCVCVYIYLWIWIWIWICIYIYIYILMCVFTVIPIIYCYCPQPNTHFAHDISAFGLTQLDLIAQQQHSVFNDIHVVYKQFWQPHIYNIFIVLKHGITTQIIICIVTHLFVSIFNILLNRGHPQYTHISPSHIQKLHIVQRCIVPNMFIICVSSSNCYMCFMRIWFY